MGYFFIIRPINCIITFFSVLTGIWVGRDIIFSTKSILAGIVGFLVCAYGNMVNDLYDVELDRINNPLRPLPKGSVQKEFVIILSIISALFAIIITIFLGLLPLIIAIFAIFLLYIYAAFFKKTPLGNLVVAIIAGLSFLFGGASANNYYSLVPFFFAIFIHLPREIIKDVIDIKGDRTFNIQSLPLLLGERKALILSASLLIFLMIMIPVPYIWGFLNLKYLIIALGIAYPLIIFTIIKTLKETKDYTLPSKLLKIVMVAGIMAFICG